VNPGIAASRTKSQSASTVTAMTNLTTSANYVAALAAMKANDALAVLEGLEPPAELGDPQLTENALKVLRQRYLKKDLENGKPIETPRQLFWRVATHIAKPELTFPGGTPQKALGVAAEFYDLMARKLFMPNSPTLMNAGREMGMLSACFVLPVEDSIEGIFDSIKATALIQKAGGGTGFSFSRLRPQGDVVASSGGTTEGPLSFIQVFSKATDAIQQGAFRRGANMGILRVDHPDVIRFIEFKDDLSKLQNYNISITVTDKFIDDLRSNPSQDHLVQNPRTKAWSKLEKRDAAGKGLGEFWTVGQVWNLIIAHAWRTGEPGVVFIDRINARNPIKNVGLIEATNPCVTADTWVHTAAGPRQVSELLGRPFVARLDGGEHASGPEGFFRTGTKDVVRLETVEGVSLRLTADHRVRRVVRTTRSAVESEWCAAGNLRTGDRVVLANHRSRREWAGRGTKSDGYSAGVLVAGGGDRTDGFAVNSALSESSALATVARVQARRVSGVSPRITTEDERDSSSYCAGLLQALFDCAGSVHDEQPNEVGVRLALFDLDDVRAAQRMLLRFGIASAIQSGEEQHELVVSNDNLREFRDVVGFSDTDKAVRLETLLESYGRALNRERFVARVARVVPDGTEDVYDVQVPGVNAFDANGLVAHNCGEQPLHPYDSCNLGSINLGLFVTGDGADAKFDWDAYKAVIHSTTRFLDNVIEANKYPLPQIDKMSKTTRRIGLGVMGFADALFKLGLAYNSVEGCAFGEEVMRVMNEESHNASEVLGQERGPFPAWDGSDWQKVGRKLRNSYTTTVAPTGTISIIADCSGGIEPMFSLAFIRQVMKDTSGKPTVMREVNYVFEERARKLGIWSEELLEQLLEQGTLASVGGVPDDTKRVFVTARDISPEWHMRMQAAFQRHCDSSISKTINFPHEATVDEVRAIYELAIDLDVKGVTVYRDGCRDVQPMALKGSTSRKEGEAGAARAASAASTSASSSGGASSDAAAEAAIEPTLFDTAIIPSVKLDPSPVRLPEIMPALRIRQMTPFGNMHVKIAVDAQLHKEREVFAQLGKGGDVANSDLEAICRLLSLWLRSNGSLELAMKQLEGIGSSLSVPTRDGRIMSLGDGLAKALARYLDAKRRHGLHALLLGTANLDVPAASSSTSTSSSAPSTPPPAASGNGQPRNVGHYKIHCPQCDGELAFQEGCVKCHGCGFSQC
jgi:ribonucleoside-diphosphate reductase alpha chain